MKKRLSILLVILLIMLHSGSSIARPKVKQDSTQVRLEQLKGLCRKQNLSDNPVNTLNTARKIEHLADSIGNQDYLLYAYVMIGQTSLFLNDSTTSSHYLNKALKLALRQNDIWGITASYGNLGILAINKENNYRKGIDYFLEGIEIAEKAIITAININDYANYNVGIYTTYANILSALGKKFQGRGVLSEGSSAHRQSGDIFHR